MYRTVNFPMEQAGFGEFESDYALRAALKNCGCDGLEGVWTGEAFPTGFPYDLVIGYHLIFYPDWLDFYREDTAALTRKYGSVQNAEQFYGCHGREGLLELYRTDMERAAALKAKYVVFHVSDVSVEECYTYRWQHTCEQVIDAAAEVINTLLAGRKWPFEFLVENQWWPGFTFTDPKLTERLLNAIQSNKSGIMLDTGHLMNACTTLHTQAEGAAYILQMVKQHGSLARAIRGVHLHQSLSCEYVKAHTGRLPDDFPRKYMEQFSASYSHILQIDQHRPWTDSSICPVLEQIAPAYLTHELAASSNARRLELVKLQTDTLKRGGFLHDV